jgi:uncharacterized protein YwgA
MTKSITESINTHIRYSKDSMVEPLTPEDWVLAFFIAGPDRDKKNPEISGMLMFTKQFFVFVKEIKKDLEDTFKFIAYDYGPYSFVLKDLIDKLSTEGYIKVIAYEERRDFVLTDKGVERAKKAYEKLDNKTRVTLEKLRYEATQLGYSGVLRYVYSRYPEYTIASKIRERVLNEY